MTKNVDLNYRHGSTVHVRLWDARTIEAKVSYIEETVAGKITVVSGSVINRVGEQQIVGVVKL